jgi:endo-1,4-beta-xylanase
MPRPFARFALVTLLALFFVSAFSFAQDVTQPTLRELAEQRGLYVGAAAWANHLDVPEHAEVLAREFNMLTPEHEAKHCMVERQPGQYDFTATDRLVAFAEEHGMTVHGHTLVWHSCMPEWIEAGAFTRDEAIAMMRDFIMTMVGRYKGRIPIWDVVNEAVADGGADLRDTPWRALIGDDYIELAFQFAHEADPDALLFYNDYGTEPMNAKSDAVYELVSDLLARGVPIHGVGLQAHFDVGAINYDSVAENIQRLGELGLQVQITELDIKYRDAEPSQGILVQQARDYRRVMEVCLDNPACTAFIVWGVSDRFTWLRGESLGFFLNPVVSPLLFDDDYAPKRPYFEVLDALALSLGLPSVLAEEDVETPTEDATVVELPEPSKSDPAQLSPDSAEGLAYYAPFPVMITLDGDASDWANIPRVSVNDGPQVPEGSDTSFEFAAAADDTYLYLLADVTDSAIVSGIYDPADGWYREDSVEFYINASGELSLVGYDTGVAQIGILAANIGNTGDPILGGSNSAASQIQVVAVETETGYLIEAAVPLVTEVWNITPEHLGTIGFQAHLNGASADDRDTKLIWSLADTEDQSWTNPSVFGRLIFWDVNQP